MRILFTSGDGHRFDDVPASMDGAGGGGVESGAVSGSVSAHLSRSTRRHRRPRMTIKAHCVWKT